MEKYIKNGQNIVCSVKNLKFIEMSLIMYILILLNLYHCQTCIESIVMAYTFFIQLALVFGINTTKGIEEMNVFSDVYKFTKKRKKTYNEQLNRKLFHSFKNWKNDSL